MPHIRITAAHGTFDKHTQDVFVAKINDAVLRVEQASVTDPGAQSLAWVFFEELPKEDVYIGKENHAQPPVVIRITTPAGSLQQSDRNALALTINDIVNSSIGQFNNRLNHWLLMDEIPVGGWAGAGTIFSIEDVKAAMNIVA
ncbi:tautomerase family protein [Pseudoalteromonas sp. T1lg23B]|uniref:tautomerase family protein n=1 Tax=Pseudoalteromonas sp. T1lg23B TaxID=2077097 RepID=UPI000CF5EAA0|nr:tautomerase family protein [Pseudoalteromonas sp. T1lg23B]